jgi:hypothetical protein
MKTNERKDLGLQTRPVLEIQSHINGFVIQLLNQKVKLSETFNGPIFEMIVRILAFIPVFVAQVSDSLSNIVSCVWI